MIRIDSMVLFPFSFSFFFTIFFSLLPSVKRPNRIDDADRVERVAQRRRRRKAPTTRPTVRFCFFYPVFLFFSIFGYRHFHYLPSSVKKNTVRSIRFPSPIRGNETKNVLKWKQKYEAKNSVKLGKTRSRTPVERNPISIFHFNYFYGIYLNPI